MPATKKIEREEEKLNKIQEDDVATGRAENGSVQSSEGAAKRAPRKKKITAEQAKDEQKESAEVTNIRVVPKRKILFVASEATPFISTGGLAEVIGSLSKALAKNDELDVRVIIPLYSDISWEYRNKFKYLGNIFVPLAWRNQYCGIFSYESDGVIFYFVDNEYYFKRPGCY